MVAQCTNLKCEILSQPSSDPCSCCFCRRMCQQLSQSKELSARLQDLEKKLGSRLSSMEEEKQQLLEQYAEAQAKIGALSQVCLKKGSFGAHSAAAWGKYGPEMYLNKMRF